MTVLAESAYVFGTIPGERTGYYLSQIYCACLFVFKFIQKYNFYRAVYTDKNLGAIQIS